MAMACLDSSVIVSDAHALLLAYLFAQDKGVGVRFVAREGEMPVRVEMAQGEPVITVNRWCGMRRGDLARIVEHLAQAICAIANAVYDAVRGSGPRTIPACVAMGA